MVRKKAERGAVELWLVKAASVETGLEDMSVIVLSGLPVRGTDCDQFAAGNRQLGLIGHDQKRRLCRQRIIRHESGSLSRHDPRFVDLLGPGVKERFASGDSVGDGASAGFPTPPISRRSEHERPLFAPGHGDIRGRIQAGSGAIRRECQEISQGSVIT